MAQRQRERHTQKARLHGIVDKHGDYQEIPGQARQPYSLQTNYPQKSTSFYDPSPYRPNNDAAVGYAGQPSIPNAGPNQVDVDTRSHGIVLDSVERPLHTRSNTGAVYRQPPKSSAQSVHENPVLDCSTQSQAAFYHKHGPKGQPSRPTVPPVGAYNESDTDRSSVSNYQFSESLTSQRLPSVSTPLKYIKLNEKDVDNVDSTHEVVVFGADRVGKTTIINCFVGDPNPNTKELDQQFKIQSVSVTLSNKESGKIMRLNIQEADKQGNASKYEQCEVAVMVYDVSVYSSLKKAKQWITRIKERIKEHPVGFVLVGNKNDMMKNNDVIMKGMQLANELKMKCLVTCATNGIYMDKLLENVAMLCYQRIENNLIESKFTNLEKKFEMKYEEKEKRFEEQQKQFEENQKIMQQHLEQSQQLIQRLQERERGKICEIL